MNNDKTTLMAELDGIPGLIRTARLEADEEALMRLRTRAEVLPVLIIRAEIAEIDGEIQAAESESVGLDKEAVALAEKRLAAEAELRRVTEETHKIQHDHLRAAQLATMKKELITSHRERLDAKKRELEAL